MRLTQVLCHRVVTADTPKFLPPKLFWGFGKGLWGPRKHKYFWIKAFKMRMQKQGLQVQTRAWEEENRPPGTVALDANAVAAVQLYEPHAPLQYPWPFQHTEYVPKSRNDPQFRQRPALLYEKHMTLYEGLKGASHFANAIIESEESLPSSVKDLESRIQVDDKTRESLKRQLNWAIRGDAVTTKMPKYRQFPRLNIVPTVQYDIHPLRKDFHILKVYQTFADLMIASRYGFVDRRVVEWPSAKVPFERDGHLCLLKLSTEFVTTTSAAISSAAAVTLAFDPKPQSTRGKELVAISPVDWKINFQETNFYPDPSSWKVGVRAPHRVETVFLTNNNINTKLQPDRFVKGRSLLYMYGLATAQARQLYGSDDPSDPVNYTDLPHPLTLHCVHYNMTKKNVIFSAFQLNTLSFKQNDGLKNQVWTEGPFDAFEEQDIIMKKLVAINLIRAENSVLANVGS